MTGEVFCLVGVLYSCVRDRPHEAVGPNADPVPGWLGRGSNPGHRAGLGQLTATAGEKNK